MIKVQQSIQVYEFDGEETSVAPGGELLIGIDSDWDQRNLIVLAIGEHRYTVVGADLLAAVENARNVNR